MKTIDISQLVLVSGGAGGDRADLMRRRIEGGLKSSTGQSGSVHVDSGSFSGSTGTAHVTAYPSWRSPVSGTCSAPVLKGEKSIGDISCSSPLLTSLVRGE